ncbi:PHD finger protein At1g33420 isoform X2 [Magnolia sinica]|uniref:PHD finger protein At1g33420 isoform X2 n=1 Tax=Magnolia sinica TaxID=86752 RepID=UPI002657B3C6|nr:PHD finger protein At1g33420 isoform X2 [Magnolia sinica]XP_058089984.1 PHD finger protein At1g33420 isoform X2 [Magnolia sinica]
MSANRRVELQLLCAYSGTNLHVLLIVPYAPRCKSCHYEITADDLEDWMYHQLEATTHLLHGVVHTNGYGHLLRVNGREGGSKFLSGCDIMDFWDRLCKMLRVRKISVMDVSKKYGLEYRLLHAITNGHPWYGNWGYEFGAGSYALTANAYQKAVNAISTMPLAPFFTHTRAPPTHLQDVVAFYWSLSERRLATVRDLFCFVMGLLHDAHKQAAGLACKNSGSHAVVLDRWVAGDIERVEHAMIKVLLAVGTSSWVTWRALRGAVCRAGPPELLDYCLKGLGGKSFDGKVVHTRCNPETNVVEYRVEGENNALRNISGTPILPSQKVVSEDKLLRDLKFLYGALLHPETMLSCMPQAMQELAHSSAVKLLDCKQFVKDYDSGLSKVPSPFFIRVSCQVELVDQPKDYTAPPPELIVLPITATVTDLKIEATKAFQEAYVLFKRFQALELLDYGNVDNGTRVKFLVGMVGTVRVRGRCLGNNGLHQFRMERGTESWTVDCTCGAKDDDGERMLACDSCGVWQHTRCAGIHDFDTVPSKFVCKRCGKSSRSGPAVGRRCKEQMAASMDVGGGLQALTALPFSIG